jgi:hypothetical protein
MLLTREQNIQNLLRRAIARNSISVTKDGFGTTLYSFTDELGTSYTLEQTPVFSINNITTYMYSIFLADYNIASAVISCNEKKLGRAEQIILEFFQLWSQRVIYQ